LKGRTETIERTRSTLAQLQAQYGLALHGPAGESLYDQAVNLRLNRKILSPPKTVIPCMAELKDLGRADPCLIVPYSLSIELLPAHKRLAVGGQVLSINSSPFSLPPYVLDAAFRSQGYFKGELRPILVSIQDEYRYLVRANSFFFRFENYLGSDIDHSSPSEPLEPELKAGRYHWGSDLSDELTLVIADLP
jgi:hypothetical protein